MTGHKLLLKNFMQPPEVQLATLESVIPRDKNWAFETKYDGYRLLAVRDNRTVKLYTRNGLNWTERFKIIAESLRKILPPLTIADGEVIAGKPTEGGSFSALQKSIKDNDQDSFRYYIFDLLAFRGADIGKEPLSSRRKVLEKLPVNNKNILISSQYSLSNLPKLQKKIELNSLEGLIAKRLDQPYRSGRGYGWLKIKYSKHEEFIIIGFTKHSKTSGLIGSLLLGLRVTEDLIWYCGKVGTGFSMLERRDLYRILNKIARDKLEVLNSEQLPGRTIMCKSRFVCEVGFAEWTTDGLLRQPRFLGLRKDKKFRDVLIKNSSQPFAKELLANGQS